jgi:hypothetical protein
LLLLLLLLAVLLLLWLLLRSLPLLYCCRGDRRLLDDHLLYGHTQTPKCRRQEQLPGFWHLLLLLLLFVLIRVSTTRCPTLCC